MKRALGVFLALTACGAGASPAAAQVLERHPYLQQQTADSIVVAWRTASATDSVVELGADPARLDRRIEIKDLAVQHEVTITGLRPGERTYYAVGSTAGRLAGGDPAHWLTAAPARGTRPPIRAWIVGDSGTGDAVQLAVRDAMLRHVGGTPPAIFLHLGDMAYDSGTRPQFTEAFFAPYADLLPHLPVWPTMGNHEGLSSDSGTQTGPYYDAYVLPTRGEAGGLPSGTEAYYSFDHGNVHFVVLDSHDSPRTYGGAMLQWLQRDLAATQQEWLVAYWHHPPYSKGTHDSDFDPQETDMRTYAVPMLEAAGVDLVLSGHSHVYERSFLLDGGYETPTRGSHARDAGDGRPLGSGPYVKRAGRSARDGAVYVVAGHGGAYTGRVGTSPVMYFTEPANGSCVLDVHENRLELVNVRADGQLTDRFAIVKGTGLVVAQPGGGETLVAGQVYPVRWATVGDVAQVTVSASYDGGASFQPLGTVPNGGTFAWSVPAVGTERALVRVEDAADASVHDESNATFTVRPSGSFEAIAFGQDWRYHDGPDAPPPTWSEPGFDDAAWPVGRAQLGYGEGDEATTLEHLAPPTPTVYFRRELTIDGDVQDARLHLLHDDGIAVWVNGHAVLSRYVGALDHAALAARAARDNERTEASVLLTPNPFQRGRNVVAVMVKQASATSTDLSFDLALELTVRRAPSLISSKASAKAPLRPTTGCQATPSGRGVAPALFGLALVWRRRRRRS